MTAYLIYVFSKGKNVTLILGIVMWGVLNTLNHSVFTLIQLQYSPGLFTGFLFLFLLYWIIKELKKHQILTKLIIFKGIGIGILLWLIPIILFLLFDIFVFGLHSFFFHRVRKHHSCRATGNMAKMVVDPPSPRF